MYVCNLDGHRIEHPYLDKCGQWEYWNLHEKKVPESKIVNMRTCHGCAHCEYKRG